MLTIQYSDRRRLCVTVCGVIQIMADGTMLGRLRGVTIDSAHQVKQILLDDRDQTRIPVAQLSDCTEVGLTVQLAERAGTG